MDLKQLREGHGEVVTREFKGLVFAIALPFSGQRSDVEVWMGKNDDYLRFVVTLNIYGPVTTQLSTNTDSAPITAAEFEICHELLTSNQRILVWDELDLSSRERNSLENSVFEFGDQIAFKRDRRKIEDAMRKSPELVKALITIARTLQGI